MGLSIFFFTLVRITRRPCGVGGAVVESQLKGLLLLQNQAKDIILLIPLTLLYNYTKGYQESQELSAEGNLIGVRVSDAPLIVSRFPIKFFEVF